MSGVRPIKWNIQNALCEQAPNSILYIRFCMAELLRINHKKRGLKELMKRISQNKVDKVVLLYKDRLLRFRFELVEYIASTPFFLILVYKVLGICISTRRRKEAMRWHC